MSLTRQRKVKKNLAFYVNNYKFRMPYQILIDGTFVYAALEGQFNIRDQLQSYLNGETKLLTTACIISELEELYQRDPRFYAVLSIAKQYAIHKCGHEKKPTTGAKCCMSMVARGNLSRYIIASQDPDVQSALRELPGIPLIYLHGRVPTLDPPSEASKKHSTDMLQEMYERQSKGDEPKKDVSEVPKKKRKKAKGLNPLCCLKSKKIKRATVEQRNAIDDSRKIKKKRKRVKIPSHVREELTKEYFRQKSLENE